MAKAKMTKHFNIILEENEASLLIGLFQNPTPADDEKIKELKKNIFEALHQLGVRPI